MRAGCILYVARGIIVLLDLSNCVRTAHRNCLGGFTSLLSVRCVYGFGLHEDTSDDVPKSRIITNKIPPSTWLTLNPPAEVRVIYGCLCLSGLYP